MLPSLQQSIEKVIWLINSRSFTHKLTLAHVLSFCENILNLKFESLDERFRFELATLKHSLFRCCFDLFLIESKFCVAWCVPLPSSDVHTNRLVIQFFPSFGKLFLLRFSLTNCWCIRCQWGIQNFIPKKRKSSFDASNNVSVNCFILVINGTFFLLSSPSQTFHHVWKSWGLPQTERWTW